MLQYFLCNFIFLATSKEKSICEIKFQFFLFYFKIRKSFSSTKQNLQTKDIFLREKIYFVVCIFAKVAKICEITELQKILSLRY